jgi:hypothetical protein
MKRQIAVIVLLFGSGHLALCQKIDLNNSITDYIKKSTPQATQFQKYGDLPVNTNTGAVEISVPFFSVGIKNVNWNIGLGYHTGGIKVSELAGCAGLGWSLSAGGMISARIYQRSDVFLKNNGDSSIYKQTLNVAPTYDPMVDNSCAYGSNIGIAEYIDFQKSNEDTKYQMNYIPDIFYLNAGSLNSKFFIKKDTGYCLPSKDISIIHTPGAYANNNSYPGSWLVTDENGTKYTFEPKGGNATNFYPSTTVVDTTGGNPAYYSSYNPVFALTQIENVFGEKIFLYYSTECYQYRLPDQDEYRDYTTGGQCINSGDGFFSPSHKQVGSEVCNARIDSIATTNGQVIIFKYSSRSDLIGASKLDTVSLYSRSSTATTFIKSYGLSTSYFGSGSNPRDLRLRLDSLGELNATATVNAKYCFGYNSEGLPSRISAAQDSSGYYNGQTGNTNLVPYYGGNRSFSLTYTKACALEKVKYPTGGFSLLDYELKTFGGLRIKRIKDSLDASTFNIREYEYGSPYVVGDNGSLIFSKDITEHQYVCNGPHPKAEISCPYTATYSDLISSLLDSYYGDKTVRYLSVTEYDGTSGINGKIVYSYTLPALVMQPGMIGQDEFLTEKKTYKKNGASYDLITKEAKAYATLDVTGSGLFSNSSYQREARTWGLDFDKGRDAFETSATECGGYAGSLCYPARYFQVSFRLVSSPVILSNESVVNYENDSITAKKTYGYNLEKILAPISITANDSKGNIRVDKIKYPADYSGITATDTISAGIKALVTKHVVNTPVEMTTYLKNSDSSNTRMISTMFTSYRTDMPVPYRLYNIPTTAPITDFTASSVVSSAVSKDSRYTARVLFNRYDTKGNLLEQQKVNDMSTGYLWDHSYTLPVAQVTNADSASIAYTSFEADGKGNWSFSGSVTTYPTAPTGSKGYNLSGGNITKSGLNTGTTYVLSYWTMNSSAYSISGTISGYPISGRTVNGWKYFEHKITGQSTITISGTGTIDELRLYPSMGQMVTYTYLPLIGIETQCDANNRINYYKYDNFNRLSMIHDQDKKIVKKFCYNYAGQTENCNLFANADTTVSFVRNNCGTGYVGSLVPVTVYSGTYFSTTSQSDANQLALNEINANGQANANISGTCTVCTGSFSVGSGWMNYYQSITPNSSTISLTLVIAAQSSSSFNNISNGGVIIGTVNSCCRPFTTRSFSCFESGRLWSVTVYTNGQVRLTRSGGSPLPNPGTGFTITGSYSL